MREQDPEFELKRLLENRLSPQFTVLVFNNTSQAGYWLVALGPDGRDVQLRMTFDDAHAIRDMQGDAGKRALDRIEQLVRERAKTAPVLGLEGAIRYAVEQVLNLVIQEMPWKDRESFSRHYNRILMALGFTVGDAVEGDIYNAAVIKGIQRVWQRVQVEPTDRFFREAYEKRGAACLRLGAQLQELADEFKAEVKTGGDPCVTE